MTVVEATSAPSLHAAYPLLFLLFFWAGARWYWRLVLVAYPLAMSFTLVYSGEHYAFDILLGWFYAVLAFALNRAWDRWRAARRAAREVAEPAGARAPAPASLTAAVERE